MSKKAAALILSFIFLGLSIVTMWTENNAWWKTNAPKQIQNFFNSWYPFIHISLAAIILITVVVLYGKTYVPKKINILYVSQMCLIWGLYILRFETVLPGISVDYRSGDKEINGVNMIDFTGIKSGFILLFISILVAMFVIANFMIYKSYNDKYASIS